MGAPWQPTSWYDAGTTTAITMKPGEGLAGASVNPETTGRGSRNLEDDPGPPGILIP